jgi:hypothetical protein
VDVVVEIEVVVVVDQAVADEVEALLLLLQVLFMSMLWRLLMSVHLDDNEEVRSRRKVLMFEKRAMFTCEEQKTLAHQCITNSSTNSK